MCGSKTERLGYYCESHYEQLSHVQIKHTSFVSTSSSMTEYALVSEYWNYKTEQVQTVVTLANSKTTSCCQCINPIPYKI